MRSAAGVCYNPTMLQRVLYTLSAIFVGILLGLALWGLILGMEVRRHEPGLWTARFHRVLDCGLDYSGPPFTAGSSLWLTCGSDDNSLQLWPR